ncbi:MAG: TraR/DksA family transcriptional regulator [Jatrophihabitantaceae bacterium]
MVTRFSAGADGTRHAVEYPVPSHPDIDQHRLEHFRQALFEQRRFRLEQLRELAAPEGTASDQLAEVTTALRIAAEAALTDIDAALARLHAGSYGHCVRCQRPILPERLAILPAAALCMTCQHAEELPRN